MRIRLNTESEPLEMEGNFEFPKIFALFYSSLVFLQPFNLLFFKERW